MNSSLDINYFVGQPHSVSHKHGTMKKSVSPEGSDPGFE